jgi:hypothetical protein
MRRLLPPRRCTLCPENHIARLLRLWLAVLAHKEPETAGGKLRNLGDHSSRNQGKHRALPRLLRLLLQSLLDAFRPAILCSQSGDPDAADMARHTRAINELYRRSCGLQHATLGMLGWLLDRQPALVSAALAAAGFWDLAFGPAFFFFGQEVCVSVCVSVCVGVGWNGRPDRRHGCARGDSLRGSTIVMLEVACWWLRVGKWECLVNVFFNTGSTGFLAWREAGFWAGSQKTIQVSQEIGFILNAG